MDTDYILSLSEEELEKKKIQAREAMAQPEQKKVLEPIPKESADLAEPVELKNISELATSPKEKMEIEKKADTFSGFDLGTKAALHILENGGQKIIDGINAAK